MYIDYTGNCCQSQKAIDSYLTFCYTLLNDIWFYIDDQEEYTWLESHSEPTAVGVWRRSACRMDLGDTVRAGYRGRRCRDSSAVTRKRVSGLLSCT
jgi:hypothetical protein